MCGSTSSEVQQITTSCCLRWMRCFSLSLNVPAQHCDHMSAKSLASQACCQICKRILVGTWTPWRTPTSADGRWGIYEFHKTLEDLRDCAKNESYPICKIALSRGSYASSSPSTETTFAYMPDEKYLSLNITPNGGTWELRGCCFVTLRKSMALPLAPSVLAPSVDAYRHLAATQPPLPWLALPRMGTSTCSAVSHSFIKTKLRDCCANHSLCAAADSGFLHRRGWVLQERLLSSRTIHFAKSEIVWHCLQDIGSESIPTRIIPHRSPSAPPTTTTTTTTQSAWKGEGSLLLEIDGEWGMGNGRRDYYICL